MVLQSMALFVTNVWALLQSICCLASLHSWRLLSDTLHRLSGWHSANPVKLTPALFLLSLLHFADQTSPLCFMQAVQTGTVVSNGVGTDLSVQSLYAGAYTLLSTNVSYGAAKLPYAPSGAGPKASSFYTMWNVKVSSAPACYCAFSSHHLCFLFYCALYCVLLTRRPPACSAVLRLSYVNVGLCKRMRVSDIQQDKAVAVLCCAKMRVGKRAEC